jgi:hypothetical protein
MRKPLCCVARNRKWSNGVWYQLGEKRVKWMDDGEEESEEKDESEL